jgi:phosphopantetheine adenylyltransferase
MSEHNWLEPIDRRIKQVKEETEAIKKETAALAALYRLYDENGNAMKRLADS